MSVRNQLVLRLAKKARPLTALISVICLYFLTILPLIGDRVNVTEDTMTTGRTPPFVLGTDIPSQAVLQNASSVIKILDLQEFSFTVSTGENIYHTIVESKRGDTREAVVCAVVISETGLMVTAAVAQALQRAQWLARDVYFVFIPRSVSTFAYGLREWLTDFYFAANSSRSLSQEKPLIRAAFAIDLSNNGTLFLDYEGINGILAEQDVSNLLFEVADELRVPLRVRPVYESIASMAFNGGVHSPHTALLDMAIPAITLTRDSGPAVGSSVIQMAQVVGKYLRALSSLHHQLHHSTSVFFYSTYRQDVSQGKIVPLLVGLMSPWFVSVVDPAMNEIPIEAFAGIVALCLSVFLVIGGLTTWSIISTGTSSDSSCTTLVEPNWAIDIKAASLMVILGLTHVLVSVWISKRTVFDFAEELKSNAFKMGAIIMTMLIVFHWGAAALAMLFIFPLLAAATPLRGSAHWSRKALSCFVFSVTALAFLSLIFGTSHTRVWNLPLSHAMSTAIDQIGRHSSNVRLPIELLKFLRELISGSLPLGKSTSELIQEFHCVQGFAVIVIWMIIFPSFILALEVMICHSKIAETNATARLIDWSPRILRKSVALICLVIAFIWSQYLNS